MIKSRHNWLPLLLSLFSIIVLLVIVSPRFYQDGPNRHSGIISNLRQLDGAKQQWALAHGMTGNVEVTAQDISPYLEHFTGWTKSVMGERYILNRLMELPEAELTKDFQHYRKGTRFRLPNEPVQATAAQHGVATNL